MFIKRFKKQMPSGFTLIETIVSLTLGAMLAIWITLIATTGIRHVSEIKRQERLHSNALFITNQLSYWIKQAKDISVPSPETLIIKLPDSSEKNITKTGNEITVDGETLNEEEIEITKLKFTKLTNSVQTGFTIKTKTGAQILSATTTVAKRNFY